MGFEPRRKGAIAAMAPTVSMFGRFISFSLVDALVDAQQPRRPLWVPMVFSPLTRRPSVPSKAQRDKRQE